ncbi:MAG: hypothetical protein WAM66_03160 [Acidobacteriaceae bacterium]
MTELPSPVQSRARPEGPNFGLIVVLAGVAFAICLVIAYIVVSSVGPALLPATHYQGEPTSRLVLPAKNWIKS